MTKRQEQCSLNRMQRSDSPHSSCTSSNQPIRISFSSRDPKQKFRFSEWSCLCKLAILLLILAVANCNVVDGKFSGDVTLQSCKRICILRKNTSFLFEFYLPLHIAIYVRGTAFVWKVPHWTLNDFHFRSTTPHPPPSCWNTTLCPSYIGLPLGNSEERRRSGNLIDEGTQVSHFDGFSNSKNQMPWQERKCLCDCFPGGCEGNPWISDNGRR